MGTRALGGLPDRLPGLRHGPPTPAWGVDRLSELAEVLYTLAFRDITRHGGTVVLDSPLSWFSLAALQDAIEHEIQRREKDTKGTVPEIEQTIKTELIELFEEIGRKADQVRERYCASGRRWPFRNDAEVDPGKVAWDGDWLYRSLDENPPGLSDKV